MSRKQRLLYPLVSIALALAAASGAAHAQTANYPSRPIRIVIPFTPGGAADVTARLVAEKLTGAWKQSVVVENRPSSSGIVGTDVIAKATPDGYTIGMISVGHAAKPGIYAKLPYDTMNDFTFLTMSANVGLVMVVNPGVPAGTVQELIALARREPGKLAFASSGAGTSGHLGAELLMMRTGIRLTHIPYKGSTQAHPAVLSGEVQMMVDTILAILPHIKSGRVRALGVTATSRSALLPDVPPIADTVPGYEAGSWGGFVAPARLSPEVKQKLHAEIVRALTLPEIRDRLGGLGADVVTSSPDEFRRFVQSEVDKWSKVAKAAGIKAE